MLTWMRRRKYTLMCVASLLPLLALAIVWQIALVKSVLG